jgi:hypothetical protein
MTAEFADRRGLVQSLDIGKTENDSQAFRIGDGLGKRENRAQIEAVVRCIFIAAPAPRQAGQFPSERTRNAEDFGIFPDRARPRSEPGRGLVERDVRHRRPRRCNGRDGDVIVAKTVDKDQVLRPPDRTDHDERRPSPVGDGHKVRASRYGIRSSNHSGVGSSADQLTDGTVAQSRRIFHGRLDCKTPMNGALQPGWSQVEGSLT